MYLSYASFYAEILGDYAKASEIAKKGFDAALAE